MSRFRNQQKVNLEVASDTDSAGLASDQDKGCIPSVHRLFEKYSTPNRKPPSSASSVSKPTPGSSRRVGQTRSKVPLKQNNDNNGNCRIADPVEVYCRVRPLENSCNGSCIKITNDKSLVLTPPETCNAMKLGTAKENTYTFQKVFNDTVNQKTIFSEITLPLVQDLLNGKNALLFAYGVTGSGKTFTMSGTSAENGIMPRCLDIIFNSISKVRARKFVFKPDRLNGFDSQSKADAMSDRQKELLERQKDSIPKTPRFKSGRGVQNMEAEYAQRVHDDTFLPLNNKDSVYAVFITYVEIYNNFVYDLLDESPIEFNNKKNSVQTKMLREDANHNIYVNTVSEVEVESPEEAFEVYARGQRRRRMAHTALNTESSRSHSIFNIRLVQSPLDSEGEEVAENKNFICISQLSLVDLAGSERHTRTQATGDRLKEAGNINNSLMTLRKCMDLLRENQQTGSNKVVPYRDSKLTHFLKNYFDGEGRVRMVLCVNPGNEDYDENLHVMQFAELTQEVQVQRPQERKLDPMTPGRRKANEIYKTAKRQLVEERIIEENELPVSDVQLVFGLGVPLPLCKMTKPSEEELLKSLKKALEMRIKGRAELASFIMDKRQSYRLRLVGMEREIEYLKTENNTLKYRCEKFGSEKDSMENVIRTMQAAKNEMESKLDEQQKNYRQQQEELATYKMEIRQREVAHLKERDRLKSDMDLQRELDELKRERQLQREEAKLKAEFRSKDKTIEAVRKLVSGEVSTRRSRGGRSGFIVGESNSTTASDSDIPGLFSPPNKSSRSSKFTSAPHLLIDSAPPAFTKSRRPGIAVANPRKGRSRSTDNDLWVEHTPGLVVKSGTVFQPVMKKKLSVNKLTKADDLVSRASKYCLATQEVDSEGDIETKLYKADILPTIGGGAQVIFNAMETLREKSPTAGCSLSPSRKRPSSPALEQLRRRSNRNREIMDEDLGSVNLDPAVAHCTAGKKSRQK